MKKIALVLVVCLLLGVASAGFGEAQRVSDEAPFLFQDAIYFGMSAEALDAAAQEAFGVLPQANAFLEMTFRAVYMPGRSIAFIGFGSTDVWHLTEIIDINMTYMSALQESDSDEGKQIPEYVQQGYEEIKYSLVLQYGECSPVQETVSDYLSRYTAAMNSERAADEDMQARLEGILRWYLPQAEGCIAIELMTVIDQDVASPTVVYRYLDQAAYDALLAQ